MSGHRQHSLMPIQCNLVEMPQISPENWLIRLHIHGPSHILPTVYGMAMEQLYSCTAVPLPSDHQEVLPGT